MFFSKKLRLASAFLGVAMLGSVFAGCGSDAGSEVPPRQKKCTLRSIFLPFCLHSSKSCHTFAVYYLTMTLIQYNKPCYRSAK